MDIRKNFETELPENYRETKIIDAKNPKVGIIFNLVAFVPVIFAVLCVYLLFGHRLLDEIYENYPMYLLALFCFVLLNLAYIVLHELVHGVAYKLLTHRKLTFGISWTAAYCGVPDIYVYRRAALIAVLAPFLVFTAVFGAGCLLLPTALWKSICILLLGLHIGGCAGDLYNALLYLFRYKDPCTLTRDMGLKQIFYTKEP